MKKIIFSLLAICMISATSYAQKVYSFPSSSSPILKISVETDTWTVDNSEGIFTITPKNSSDANNFVCMIWASEDPSSETAIDDIANQASTVVSTLLTDLTWAEDVTDFENNGITFVGTDGEGYYESDDGTKTKMVTSIMLLMPDATNVVALVFFATGDVYDKYEDSFLNMILSFKPAE